MEKEQYIHKVLSSLDGAQRASANEFIETRILAGLEDKSRTNGILFLKPKMAGFALSCLFILMCLNFYFVYAGSTSSTAANSTTTETTNNHVSSTDIKNDFFTYTDVQY